MLRLGSLKEEMGPTVREFKVTLYLLRQSPLALAGIAVTIFTAFLALFANNLAPYNPLAINLAQRLQPPSTMYLFGTDQLGRDILSRVIAGYRISAVMGVEIVILGGVSGAFLGLLAGYLGGKVDEIIMRVTDMFLAFPSLVLAMAISAALGPSLEHTFIAVAAVWWPSYARLVRGSVLSVKQNEYVEAAKAVGESEWRIMFVEVLPNVSSSIIVQATLDLGKAILTASSLSFIGFGAQPPIPEWGAMISSGRDFIAHQWWVATFPGLAILLTVIGFNLLGDGLRDALDPRMRLRN
jgi:peptide/nickel transport system permease protein